MKPTRRTFNKLATAFVLGIASVVDLSPKEVKAQEPEPATCRAKPCYELMTWHNHRGFGPWKMKEGPYKGQFLGVPVYEMVFIDAGPIYVSSEFMQGLSSELPQDDLHAVLIIGGRCILETPEAPESENMVGWEYRLNDDGMPLLYRRVGWGPPGGNPMVIAHGQYLAGVPVGDPQLPYIRVGNLPEGAKK